MASAARRRIDRIYRGRADPAEEGA